MQFVETSIDLGTATYADLLESESFDPEVATSLPALNVLNGLIENKRTPTDLSGHD